MTKHKRSDIFDDPNVTPEGLDVSDLPDTSKAKAMPKHEGTINELMAGWWHEARAMTLDPAGVGDHFVAYAAARGWALVDADTPPPPPEADPVP